MTLSLATRRRGFACFVAAGLLSAALPTAAAPKSADPALQAQVKVGMTQQEVTQLLGKPQRTRKFSKDVTTWGYPSRKSETWFLVDIGADGKVKAVEEKYVPAF